MKLTELMRYLDELLESDRFSDYGPNGLQVEGTHDVKKIVTGVSACIELFDRAVEKKADAVLVHHGLFWDGQPVTAVGSRKERLSRLIKNDISLIAYHLPLDAHPQFGNNAGIFRALNLSGPIPFGMAKGNAIGFLGSFEKPLSRNEAQERIRAGINPDARFHFFGPDEIRKVAVCSGGAQSLFSEAIRQKADLYITGEESEWVYHLAKEEKAHYAAAGHHATERFGPMLLAVHLKEKFGLDAEFIDVENPI